MVEKRQEQLSQFLLGRMKSAYLSVSAFALVNPELDSRSRRFLDFIIG